ncbi:hypothetical protein B0T26DRAFT_648163 [Lasiosphaeria miniovina]|uniref:Oxidoreductase n=1 Tax=Lasiosphaeria miniovina TaxID=1954250 RepID=A0AA40DWY8_9PEZI|nr:uncharacterized protein B0T26DRAFT_648163 [Lasiosphaeria miniovina]KAK0718670.1 hypothetical protein B0T26DRAFT_648163 [Lasiosphaeria miniovina]
MALTEKPRVWLITGASSGLGLELAKVAVSHGDLVIAASRNPDKVKELAGKKGVQVARLDHNEPLDQIQSAVRNIIAIHGTIDVVVNNAAYVQTGTVEETSPEETLRQFQANLFGPANLYRAVLPYLRAKGHGTLVTVGSMAAWYPMESCNMYNASKAAVRSMMLGLADEVAAFGIKHCLVEPGFFRTGLLKPGGNFAGTAPAHRLDEYAELNASAEKAFEGFHGNQLGNPIKGAEVIYDVVTSSGCAAGRSLPTFLPVGSDASTEIIKAAYELINGVEEWRSISVLSDFVKNE